ncbi:Sin-like protein conserved region-domain-containing protein [Ilyonectria robusta]|uniref:Sin-like protein conserved region-domain-containing protein n=1 Tax=Ilyonectria robusta TaxID=1079257 RepID=UPI001E8E2B86|nr:Sin-like protein conserved region-domain-containing protein [Ilyonectria robusta]KAH8736470.1 Sin-like protein conserved region-domain-containing protein [Ilyonectria robusta]
MDLDADIDPSLTATLDDDDDPVTATYQVFINPSLPLGRRLLVLQHPNRTDDAPRPPPTELRVKANAGMVEVDMPLDNSAAYDREKGLKWGRTLHTSMAAKNGGSHGLAGGFGFGTVQRGAGGRKKAEGEDDDVLDWTEAVRQDKVLRTQTLGGQYPDYKEVQHMVGVFQGKDLHLTPVSSLVHLRPQLHHIDAAAQLERQAAASASKEAAPTTGAGAARAIHMTVKATGDGDGVTTETMADRLRAVQSEHWRTLRYTDENEEAAWEVYNESLFLRPAQEGDAENEDAAGEDERPLDEAVPHFGARWTDKQLLEAVSGIEKPDPVPVVKEEPKPIQPAPVQPVQPEPAPEEARKPKLRPRGGAAAGPSRRGGRTRGASS